MSNWINIEQHGSPKEPHKVIDAFVDGQIEHALYYGGRTFYTRQGRPIAQRKVTHYRLVDNNPPEDIKG